MDEDYVEKDNYSEDKFYIDDLNMEYKSSVYEECKENENDEVAMGTKVVFMKPG